MKISKMLVGSLAVVSLFSLSACSTFKGSGQGGAQVMNANQGGGGVQAQGYGSTGSSFASSNPLCQLAPAQGGVEQHYFFDFNKNNVRSQYMNSLQVQANYLVAHPNQKAKVTGNTDDRGSREYNIALGWRRAKAIAAALEQYGVKSSQLSLVSYGAEKPVMTGMTEADYQCNRRSDIIYLNQ